ncbi:type I-E CRISPR-associated protein Cas6/Cse3/CasE [Nocardia sp. NPDC050435]|uniref:type I-E CRISPR-associated protein Cas6/Cse3/CasE n=1 Tax=Nocardia sp. NPDC050435 TaxID=3155040 RepID=UPI0033FE969B
MFLSRIPLNPARRGTQKFLSSRHAIHAAVMSSFPPEALERNSAAARVLWRLDHSGHELNLYVVSPVEPDFTHIVEQCGWPTTTAWSTRKYGELLDSLTAGQRWHFRLTANPVYTTNIKDAEGNMVRGKRIGLNADGQLDWLRNKADRLGFEFDSCGPAGDRQGDVAVVARETVQFGKKVGTEAGGKPRQRRTVTLSVASYEGTLVVADPALLRTAMVQGIGRAKGYGCGLLTLAPSR